MASPSHLRVPSLAFVLIVLTMNHCSARKVLMEDMMNKQENSDPKHELKVKPAPMAHETDPGRIQKQEKGEPKDEDKVKPPPMAHGNDLGRAQKQEKSVPKHEDKVKPAPMAHGTDLARSQKQEKGEPKDEFKVKPAPMTHETDHGLAAQKNNDTMTSHEGEIGLECGGVGCDSPCYELPCNGESGGIVVIREPPVVIYPPPLPYIIVNPPCQPCEPWSGPEPCPCPCEEEGSSDIQAIKTEGGGHDTESINKAHEEGETKGGGSLLAGKEKTQINIGLPATGNAADAPMPAMIYASNLHA